MLSEKTQRVLCLMFRLTILHKTLSVSCHRCIGAIMVTLFSLMARESKHLHAANRLNDLLEAIDRHELLPYDQHLRIRCCVDAVSCAAIGYEPTT